MAEELPNRTMLSQAELLSLHEFWPTIASWLPRSTEWGTTNATYFVGDQDQYILKIYGDDNTRQHRFEHELLLSMRDVDLSFAIPLPHRASSGDVLVQIGSEQSQLQAAIYQVIPGNSVPRGDNGRTFHIGKTLGELHRALGALKFAEVDAVLPPWGDLDRIHPLVPNWREITHELGMESNVVNRTEDIIAKIDAVTPRLRSVLPSQVVHADYVQPNVLFMNDNVSGVIDFEFATYDLRSFDLAASFYHFCLSPWNDAPRWNLIDSFMRGYLSQVGLISEEIEALPMLLRWQRLSCLVYWTGMYRQRLATHQSLIDAAEENVILETWIGAHGDQLSERCQRLLTEPI